MEEAKHFIGNEWTAAAGGDSIAVIDPSDGQPFARLARGNAADIDVAVAAARRAFDGAWGALSAAERPIEAIEQLKEALRLKPDFAEAHCNLGRVLNNAGKNLEALAHCEAALRLRPDFVEAHFTMGNVLVRIPGRADDAAAEYRETLRLQPDHLGAHFNLALVLLNSFGHRDEAVEHLEAVLRLQPANETAKLILSKVQALRP